MAPRTHRHPTLQPTTPTIRASTPACPTATSRSTTSKATAATKMGRMAAVLADSQLSAMSQHDGTQGSRTPPCSHKGTAASPPTSKLASPSHTFTLPLTLYGFEMSYNYFYSSLIVYCDTHISFLFFPLTLPTHFLYTYIHLVLAFFSFRLHDAASLRRLSRNHDGRWHGFRMWKDSGKRA